MASIARALRHRNFRLFLAGQIFALIGYWMQTVAQGWLLYRVTGSATLLGVLGFASSLPVIVIAPLAGLWSDRWNRHRAMFIIQVLEMLQAVVMAGLALTGLLEPWHVIALAMVLGVLVAIELPLRSTYLLELVGDRRDLPNAIAVTSLMANSGRLVGPALAGLTIAAFGEAFCFLLNALSFVAVIVSFLMIRVVAQPATGEQPAVIEGLREGFVYAWHSPPIRLLLGLLVVLGLLAAPYQTLMPALVRSVFGGDSDQMGYFVAASGLGGVLGTLFLAARASVRGLLRIIAAAALAAGGALALLAWSPAVWVALPLLVLIGFGLLVTSVSVNMILQTIVDDDKRGRVMSLYTVAFLGMSPFGSLVAGAVADHIGIAFTLTAGGLCCAVAAVYLHSRREDIRAEVKPIYDRLEIGKGAKRTDNQPPMNAD